MILEAEKSKICSSKSDRLETQESGCSSHWDRRLVFLFYSGLRLIGRGPPMLWRTLPYPKFTHLNVNHTKNTLHVDP